MVVDATGPLVSMRMMGCDPVEVASVQEVSFASRMVVVAALLKASVSEPEPVPRERSPSTVEEAFDMKPLLRKARMVEVGWRAVMSEPKVPNCQLGSANSVEVALFSQLEPS